MNIAALLFTFAALPNVLLVGDSVTTYGWSTYAKTELADEANVYRLPENARYTGYSLEHLDEWLGMAAPWSVVVVNWGLWDIAQVLPGDQYRTPIGQYEKNIDTLLRMVHEANGIYADPPRIIFSTITPVPPIYSPLTLNADVVRYNGVIRAMVAGKRSEDYNIRMNDMYTFVLPNLAAWQIDSDIHYWPVGYSAMGQRMAGLIREELDRPYQELPASSNASLFGITMILSAIGSAYVWTSYQKYSLAPVGK
jgi:hypothetical protein